MGARREGMTCPAVLPRRVRVEQLGVAVAAHAALRLRVLDVRLAGMAARAHDAELEHVALVAAQAGHDGSALFRREVTVCAALCQDRPVWGRLVVTSEPGMELETKTRQRVGLMTLGADRLAMCRRPQVNRGVLVAARAEGLLTREPRVERATAHDQGERERYRGSHRKRPEEARPALHERTQCESFHALRLTLFDGDCRAP
jgi:hypothetical protein